jgi:hypothetical protein
VTVINVDSTTPDGCKTTTGTGKQVENCAIIQGEGSTLDIGKPTITTLTCEITDYAAVEDDIAIFGHNTHLR